MLTLLGTLVLISPFIILFGVVCKLEGVQIAIQTYIAVMLILAVTLGISWMGVTMLNLK